MTSNLNAIDGACNYSLYNMINILLSLPRTIYFKF